MDPLTAALQLARTIAEIIKLVIESQPADVRAEFARIHLEDLKRWRDFVDKLVKRNDSERASVERALRQIKPTRRRKRSRRS
jgi:hypothetical protein